MRDGKTYYQGQEFFLKTCNYLLTIYVDEDNGFLVGPHANYYVWADNNYPHTQGELSIQLHAHLKLMKEMGFNSVRIMNAGVRPKYYSDQLALAFWHRSTTTTNPDPIPFEGDTGFMSYAVYQDMNEDGIAYLKTAMQIVLDIADIYDIKVIWVMGGDARYVDGSKKYRSLLQYSDHNIVSQYKDLMGALGDYFKNHPALFAYDLFHEIQSFDNSEFPDGNYVNQLSLAPTVKDIVDTIKTIDNNHYTTTGLFGENTFFRLGTKPFYYCDFLNFHNYDHNAYLYEEYPLGTYVNRYVYYFGKTIDCPWMIGENGMQTEIQENTPELIEGDATPVSEAQLTTSVINIMNQASKCNSLGYAYWQFANEYNWQNVGVLKHNNELPPLQVEINTNPAQVVTCNYAYKDLVNPPENSVFNTFTVSDQECTFDQALYADIYKAEDFSPLLNQTWKGIVLEGEQPNMQPVPDAIVKVHINGTSEDYFTFTDSEGMFSVKSQSEFRTATVSVSKYGYDVVKREPVASAIQIEYHINKIAFPEKESYPIINNITVNSGDVLVMDKPDMIYGHVTVNDGGILRISSKISFDDNSQLIVNPGGKLILEEGALLTAIHQAWFGIVLNGDYTENRPELTSTGNTTIAKAHYGIYNYLNNQYQDANILLNLDGTKFINNYQDILINRNTGNVLYFKDCEFIITEDAPEEFGINNTCDEFIEINYSDHAKFVNCDFADYRNFVSSVPEKVGIETINLKKLEVLPDPFMGARKSTFTNLYYGIKSTTGWGGEINIRNCDFTTVRGVYLDGYSSYEPVTIINSTFNILGYPQGKDVNPGEDPIPEELRPYGVYLDNTTNKYQIEGNIFKSENGIPDDKYGLIANSNGGLSNEFYRNRFYNLENSVQAIGVNKALSGDDSKGLQILCNKFYNTKTDVFVNSEMPFGGIAKYQGSLTKPAGNLFSSGAVLCNYKNELSHIDYFVRNLDDPDYNFLEIPSSVEGDILVTPLINSFIGNSCPDYSTNLPDHILVDEIYLELESSSILESSITSMLDDIVDGGNTGQVISDIIHLDDNSAWVTYYDLMYNSPYLSDTVLKNVSKKETGLTVPMIRDILVANPQSAKNSDIKKLLKDRDNQLPDYMIDQIEAGETFISMKENLEIQRAEQRVIYDKSLMNLVAYYYELEDSLAYAEDSIVALLKMRSEAPYYFELAEYYFNKSRYLEGKEVLNSMYAVCELTDLEKIEIGDLISFTNFYQNLLKLTKGDLYNLNDFYIEQLKVFEDKGGRVGAKARVILLMNDASDYKELVYKPEEVILPRNTEHKNLNNANPKFSVYPNPAKEHINVEYKLIEHKGAIQFVITDITGQIVLQKQLFNLQDIVIIKIAGLSKGTYNCSLYNGSKLEFNEKLIIDN